MDGDTKELMYFAWHNAWKHKEDEEAEMEYINYHIFTVRHSFTQEDEQDLKEHGDRIKRELIIESWVDGSNCMRWGEKCEKINEGRQCLMQLYKTTDMDKVAMYRLQQIRLVGSQKLYDKITRDFVDHSYSPSYSQEYFKLFEWRKKFFKHHFPRYTWTTRLGNDIGDHKATMAAQMIGADFDRIVAIACKEREYYNHVEDLPVMYADDETHAGYVWLYFDPDGMKRILQDYDENYDYALEDLEDVEMQVDGYEYHDMYMYTPFCGLGGVLMYIRSGALHQNLLFRFSTRPSSLQALAAKTIVQNWLDIKNLPPVIAETVLKAGFLYKGNIKEFINEEGLKMLTKYSDWIEHCRRYWTKYQKYEGSGEVFFVAPVEN